MKITYLFLSIIYSFIILISMQLSLTIWAADEADEADEVDEADLSAYTNYAPLEDQKQSKNLMWRKNLYGITYKNIQNKVNEWKKDNENKRLLFGIQKPKGSKDEINFIKDFKKMLDNFSSTPSKNDLKDPDYYKKKLLDPGFLVQLRSLLENKVYKEKTKSDLINNVKKAIAHFANIFYTGNNIQAYLKNTINGMIGCLNADDKLSYDLSRPSSDLINDLPTRPNEEKKDNTNNRRQILLNKLDDLLHTLHVYHKNLKSKEAKDNFLKKLGKWKGIYPNVSLLERFYDPNLTRDVISVKARFQINGKKVDMIRTPTVANASKGIVSEYKGFMDDKKNKKQKHLYINYQTKYKEKGLKNWFKAERYRVKKLEELQKEYNENLILLTISKESEFYNNAGAENDRKKSIDIKAFKKLFAEEINKYEDDNGIKYPDNSNFCGFHAGTPCQDKMIETFNSIIDNLYGSKDKDKLTFEQRRAAIELTYNSFINQMIKADKVTSFNHTCKDAIDRGGAASSIHVIVQAISDLCSKNEISDNDMVRFDNEVLKAIPSMIFGDAIVSARRSIQEDEKKQKTRLSDFIVTIQELRKAGCEKVKKIPGINNGTLLLDQLPEQTIQDDQIKNCKKKIKKSENDCKYMPEGVKPVQNKISFWQKIKSFFSKR